MTLTRVDSSRNFPWLDLTRVGRGKWLDLTLTWVPNDSSLSSDSSRFQWLKSSLVTWSWIVFTATAALCMRRGAINRHDEWLSLHACSVCPASIGHSGNVSTSHEMLELLGVLEIFQDNFRNQWKSCILQEFKKLQDFFKNLRILRTNKS